MSDTCDYYVALLHPPRATFMDFMTAEEQKVFGEHFEYLKQIRVERKLLLAGPLFDGTFGLIIYRTGDEAEARTWANDDPVVKSGVAAVTIHPFRLSRFDFGSA